MQSLSCALEALQGANTAIDRCDIVSIGACNRRLPHKDPTSLLRRCSEIIGEWFIEAQIFSDFAAQKWCNSVWCLERKIVSEMLGRPP